MVDLLKQIFVVPKCKVCFQPADRDNMCDDCRVRLDKCRIQNPQLPVNKNIPFVDHTYASYKYEGAARNVITGAKFRNPAPFISSFLADISIDINVILEQNNIDMIVAVPCHKSKLYTQEFDLPAEMARRLSRLCNTEYSQCIVKVRKTDKQHNLPKDRRKSNLMNAFKVVGDVKGRRILVIDDVITTGTTVSTVAQDLKIAGRERVYAWAYTLNIEKGNT